MDIRGLAYVVAQHRDPGVWRQFGERTLGMQARDGPDGTLWLRLDERACRIVVEPGADDRYVASGWEVPDEAAFEDALRELVEAGIDVQRGDGALVRRRSCLDVAWFVDPSGNRHELALGFRTDFSRFVSPTGTTFVTGDLGMGHTALPAPNFDATWQFLRDTMGFRLSDLMRHSAGPGSPPARIYFLHCNCARHHSLAIAEMPSASGCIHMMLEVPDMDEIGRAIDRARQQGVKLRATLGRHVNDRMISFYIETPSGFALEYGCGGRVVDDWRGNIVHETTAPSLWGHDFSLGFTA
jgi:3,4-dihydroxy-9,10-secoandrosta-1,3,5(10)-triene-9,17-dione 4,5-dioxygenase